MRITITGSIALAICVSSFGGCSSGSGTLPSLVAVKGKVTYKGHPLTKGVIKFEPDGFGRPATGKLQSDGTFVLTTTKDADGVVAGHHRVSITELDKSLATDRSFKKYTSPNTSKLTAEVTADSTNIDFEIP